jgi:hypothetical protein
LLLVVENDAHSSSGFTGLHKNISALRNFSFMASSLDNAVASNLNHTASANTFADSSLSGQFVVSQSEASCIALSTLLCPYLAASAYSPSLTTDVGSRTFAKSLISCCLSCAVAVPFSSLSFTHSRVFILLDSARYSFLLRSAARLFSIDNKSFFSSLVSGLSTLAS